MRSHPSDGELAAVAAGHGNEATEAHLESCVLCGTRLAAAGPEIPLPQHPPAVDVTFPPVVGNWPSAPQPGEIWRLAWEEVRQLAVVLGDRASGLTVTPLLVDVPEASDEWTLILAAEQNPLGLEVGVAVAHAFVLPLYVFDERLGVLDDDTLERTLQAEGHYRRGSQPDGSFGQPILTLLDPRLEAIGDMIDDFVELVEATWVEEPAAAAIDWIALDDAIDLPADRLFHLSAGGEPTPIELHQAEQAGFDIRRRYDPDLVATMNRPIYSARLRRCSRRTGLSEAAERRVAASHLMDQSLTRAARGDYGGEKWARLLEEYMNDRS